MQRNSVSVQNKTAADYRTGYNAAIPFGGEYMTGYIVTAYCDQCSTPHSTGVELDWPKKISPTKSIAEAFHGTALPPEISVMSRNYFLCPQTGKMYKQTDNNKLYLIKNLNSF